MSTCYRLGTRINCLVRSCPGGSGGPTRCKRRCIEGPHLSVVSRVWTDCYCSPYVCCPSRILISQSLHIGSAGDHLYCLTSLQRLSPYYMDWLACTPIVHRLYCLAHSYCFGGGLASIFSIGTRYLSSSINSPHSSYLYAK